MSKNTEPKIHNKMLKYHQPTGDVKNHDTEINAKKEKMAKGAVQ